MITLEKYYYVCLNSDYFEEKTEEQESIFEYGNVIVSGQEIPEELLKKYDLRKMDDKHWYGPLESLFEEYRYEDIGIDDFINEPIYSYMQEYLESGLCGYDELSGMFGQLENWEELIKNHINNR
jgi:hypothetical protein